MTSETRLRVQKNTSGSAAGTLDIRADSIAAAERARQDSVNAAMARQRDSVAAAEAAMAKARADSLAVIEKARADSLAVIEAARRDSIARADSIAQADEWRRQQAARYRLGGNGWYMGLGGGTSAPNGNFKNLGYNSGYNVNVPIGWHKENSLFGIRMDFGYNQFSGRTFLGSNAGTPVTLTNANPKVLSATFNLTAAVPLSFIRNVNLYGVGGGGIYHFRDFGGASALGGFLGNDVLQSNEVASNKVTRNKFGAQIGAGLDWAVGTSAIYVESRLVNVFADQGDNVQFRDFVGDNKANSLRWVPIVLGVKIR